MNKYKKHFLFCAIYLLYNAISTSQTIQIAPELNLRNDFGYYIIPHDAQKISLLRDKAYRLTIQNQQGNQDWSIEQSVELKGKKWQILEAIENGENISIIYRSLGNNSDMLVHGIYKSNGELKSEDTIFMEKNHIIKSNILLKLSDNKKYIGLGYEDYSGLKHIALYNKDSSSLLYRICLSQTLNYEHKSISELEITDDGKIFIVGDVVSRLHKKQLTCKLAQLSKLGKVYAESEIIFEEKLPVDLKLKYNANNRTLMICGLYGNKNMDTPEGFYQYTWDPSINTLTNNYNELSANLYKEWTGREKKKNTLNNLSIVKIIPTDSNQIIAFYESNKELSRKPYFNSSNETPISMRRWTDYYYEDIIAIKYNQQGNIVWEKVLYKKQFSQDDDGLFSSFFLFETSEFLRIIFNDEIKTATTVSEYIMLPNGHNIRKSILNTTNNNLLLRFKDAQQIDANTLVVPSENNGKMSLVKLSFDH